MPQLFTVYTNSKHEGIVAAALFARASVAFRSGVALLRVAPAPCPASKIPRRFRCIPIFHWY